MTNNTAAAALAEYSDERRLKIYKMITSACTHLYSKGNLQENKFKEVADLFADLALHDPIFMAHLAAWAAKHDSKDLKVMSVYFNALNDANGLPFFKGSTKNKPNFREISYALLQQMDPHLVSRVLELCHKKFEVKEILNHSRHFPTGLKTAFQKYLLYRENNLDMLRGAKKAGLTQKLINIYRFTRTAPSDEAAAILHWKQKNKDIKMEEVIDFATLTSAEIAEVLVQKKYSPTIALSILPKDKITAKVASALLSNCSGNQAIILYNWFAKNGFLDVASIKKLFHEKVKTATTAIDRIDTLTRNADAEDKKEMASIRSEKRKETAKTESLGKIYLHIDASGSMQRAIEYCKDRAAIIAECVTNPRDNFAWGLFGNGGKKLKVPNEFTKEDFHQALYGVTANMGSTDCIALYNAARAFGADIDIYITDQGHNIGTISKRIEIFHANNPTIAKPKAAVIVDFSGNRNAAVKNTLEQELLKVGIPVAIIQPEALKESALVASSVRAAMVGEMAIINEIMETTLPSLPRWYHTIEKQAVEETTLTK
jgi:hypothetical protein